MAYADDAYTVVQSEARIRMKAELASGKSVTIRTLDGSLASIGDADAPNKIAVSARLIDKDRLDGDVQLFFWLLTPGANGHQSLVALEKYVTRAGAASVTPTSTAVLKVVRGLSVVDVAPAPTSKSGTPASENPPAD